MRWSALLALLVATGVVGCTANPSGPEHWRAACEQAAPAPSPGVPEFDVAECEATFRSYPRAVADDVAKCALRSVRTGVPAVACHSDETHAYFDAVDRTRLRMEHVRKVVADDVRAGAPVPSNLDGVVAVEDQRDAWSTPIRVRDDGEGGVEVSSAGADRSFGTADDLTAGPDFIYFQF